MGLAEHPQNVPEWFIFHSGPILKISWKSVHPFIHNNVNKHTNKLTNRQTSRQRWKNNHKAVLLTLHPLEITSGKVVCLNKWTTHVKVTNYPFSSQRSHLSELLDILYCNNVFRLITKPTGLTITTATLITYWQIILIHMQVYYVPQFQTTMIFFMLQAMLKQIMSRLPYLFFNGIWVNEIPQNLYLKKAWFTGKLCKLNRHSVGL